MSISNPSHSFNCSISVRDSLLYCVMHWTHLRETGHSWWQLRSSLNILSHICSLTGSTTLISFGDLNFLKSPAAISTWLSMDRHPHECSFCNATFRVRSLKVCSATMNRKLKLRVLVMVQERMHVCIHTYTHLCFQKSSISVHAKHQNPFYTMKNITLFPAMAGLISNEWMRRMCLWWLGNDRKLLSATVSIPSFCKSTATMQSGNEQIIRGSFVPLSFKNHHDVQFLTHLSYFFFPMRFKRWRPCGKDIQNFCLCWPGIASA